MILKKFNKKILFFSWRKFILKKWKSEIFPKNPKNMFYKIAKKVSKIFFCFRNPLKPYRISTTWPKSVRCKFFFIGAPRKVREIFRFSGEYQKDPPPMKWFIKLIGNTICVCLELFRSVNVSRAPYGFLQRWSVVIQLRKPPIADEHLLGEAFLVESSRRSWKMLGFWL